MRLGLLTAPFPETPLAEVVDWTAANGFESIEIACWPRVDRTDPALRRHVATSTSPTCPPRQATELADEIAGKGLTISGLGYYPNPLHPDAGHRDPGHRPPPARHHGRREDGRPARQHVHGRRRREEPGRELGGGAPVWPDIVRFAKDHGRKITIENCPMLFSYDEWPGGHNLATTPRDLAPDPRDSGAARSGSTSTRRT